ncbi:hypothetical protein HPB50_024106 [Hyalomma asiaticum]|uniref:Uncharacterized protein n=1 Tax=Hyalomma asiaticum TaxID=266040 RepID=A0ACB7S5H0_HYAAI|nr:hypothetical protein HPB50_024106 [Hyalomma asiaticum]
MDAAAFYGTADFTNHARQRIRLDDESAERMLTRIADGNTSDIDLSDDDEEEMRPSQHAAATDTDGGAGPSGAAQNLLPSQDQDDQHEVVGQQKRPLLWVTSEFEPPDTTFCPEARDVSAMREPCEYFFKYFTDELFQEIARCTNIYALQTSGGELGTTPEEIKTFFGMLMIMGILKFPRIRMYWSAATQIPNVSQAMSVNRFFRLRSALHATEPDPGHTGTDKFWKAPASVSNVHGGPASPFHQERARSALKRDGLFKPGSRESRARRGSPSVRHSLRRRPCGGGTISHASAAPSPVFSAFRAAKQTSAHTAFAKSGRPVVIRGGTAPRLPRRRYTPTATLAARSRDRY